MKTITKKSRSRLNRVPLCRVVHEGHAVKVAYTCPISYNDEKRWGRELSIKLDNASIRLDGRGINAIKKVLREAGEIL